MPTAVTAAPQVGVTTPDKTSSDFDAMRPYYRLITDINDGVEGMRRGGREYLPQFEMETDPQWTARNEHSEFTNIFTDIVENLADRPFSKEVSVVEGSDRVKSLCEDIDGQGNNLHNFASVYFRRAIDYSVDWIYVDYTRTSAFTTDASGNQRRKSAAEERQQGARPYWVRVPATEMIAVYSVVINGEEEIQHARMIEYTTERHGWDEISVVQVRELNREPIRDENDNIIALDNATFRIWQQREQPIGKTKRTKVVWTIVDEGDISIGVIPLVPLVIGERKGKSWQILPAMKSCADMQREYYEEQNGLKNIKQLTAFPMLTASNVAPEKDDEGVIKKAPVGPRAVLYAPPTESGNGKWEFIEPSSTSLEFLRKELEAKEKALRELGRQPLTVNQATSNMTTGTADAAVSKSLAAIQRWALACKDALENALYLTALWIGDTVEPTVRVHTDFSLDQRNSDTFTHVATLRKDGDLSQETVWEEAQRRGILGPEFDAEAERKRLEEEQPSDEELDATLVEGQIDPRTGLPFVPPEDDETISPDEEA